jgi:transcription-repair coupling factor (superfamily II helicase)
VNPLTRPLLGLKAFNGLTAALENRKSPVSVSGLSSVTAKTHLAFAAAEALGRPALIIAHSELRAREIHEDMACFWGGGAKFFPSKDLLFYDADVKSRDLAAARFEVLRALSSGGPVAVAAGVEALFNRLSPKAAAASRVISLSVGGSASPRELSEKLVGMGYSAAATAEAPGQFAARGGILDVCSPAGAYRIEFFGDEIDSMRSLDVKSQRSLENVPRAEIYPASEVFAQDASEAARERLLAAYLAHRKNLEALGLHSAAAALAGEFADFDAAEDFSARESRFLSDEKFSGFFSDTDVNLLDYLPENALIFWEEPDRIKSRAEVFFAEFLESVARRAESGLCLPEQVNMLIPYESAVRKALRFQLVLFGEGLGAGFKPEESFSFRVKSSMVLKNQINMLFGDIKEKCADHAVVVLTASTSRGERLTREMLDFGIPAAFREAERADPKPGVVSVSRGSLREGFLYEDIKFLLITDGDIFSEKKRKLKKAKNRSKIESFLDLKTGDYVVHDAHGVGVYEGIEKIENGGASKDYMKILYADGGVVYVPVNSADSVGKYIGSENPKVNKLGGAEWSRAKSRARAAVQDLAAELIKLYAAREASPGWAFSADTVWQAEFEDSFPYDETDDQLRAIAEVKADMEKPRVMDRLLCGDVGYGKTEVAIRAAFKCVQDSKQVALLVPTTILAQQHYITFTRRMKEYPVEIELLSRFRSPKEQAESLARLKSGAADILIGTHRALSKDVVFKDLGLIIVDEEQRFGVTHKEKLKKLKTTADVLTLSATPIPRTLHMSLSGIRDLSVIEEPPEHRRPVQTYVMEYNPDFVRDAILRELSRGGQTFYLHNRVTGIDDAVARLKELVPQAEIRGAHGQMSERGLENIMNEFISGELDVLVCTTIIETGLDISNANTIIIDDADRMGLSQLYQLRGRVGRSRRMAYAYLMYTRDKILSEVAEKRLQTIREFTEFGSGFKIAMRDLEIRGAGNLLGSQQHGHLDSVGYELYCRLLQESVSELRGEKPASFDTLIDMNVNAYIPDFYISSERVKLDVYKKIAAIRGEEDLSDARDELLDRFGNLPASVAGLLEVAALKAAAGRIGAESVTQKGASVIITFHKDADLSELKFPELFRKYPGRFFYTNSPKQYLTLTAVPGETVGPQMVAKYLEEL